MLRKGFTLIELLVVITIIAILAGAAIPYVQDYIEQARYSKAQSDLGEIASALQRYELDNGKSYTNATINALVGPYLQKAYVDPWGQPYKVSNASSTAYSAGPDTTVGNGDDVTVEYRPPTALSRAYWEDTNKDGTFSASDSLILRFTRPVATTSIDVSKIDYDGTQITNGVITPTDGSWTADLKGVKLTYGDSPDVATPGVTVLSMDDATFISDPASSPTNIVPTVVIKAR